MQNKTEREKTEYLMAGPPLENYFRPTCLYHCIAFAMLTRRSMCEGRINVQEIVSKALR